MIFLLSSMTSSNSHIVKKLKWCLSAVWHYEVYPRHTHSCLMTCVESFANKVTWACKKYLSLLFLYLCSDYYLCYSKFHIGYNDKSKTFFMHDELTLSYWTCLYNDSEFLFSSICVTKETVVSCPCAIILNRIKERNCEINVQIIWKFKDKEFKLRKIHMRSYIRKRLVIQSNSCTIYTLKHNHFNI